MKTNASDETGRLYDKLIHWLYERQDVGRARSFADRLDALLSHSSEDETGRIFTQECKSLISEARGDLASAIKHRENEIRLIRRLHELSQNTESEDFVRAQYDFADLRDRLNLLAALYRDSDNLQKAIKTLKESKRLCRDHDIEFDWEDVLREYSEEQPSRMHRVHTTARKKRL